MNFRQENIFFWANLILVEPNNPEETYQKIKRPKDHDHQLQNNNLGENPNDKKPLQDQVLLLETSIKSQFIQAKKNWTEESRTHVTFMVGNTIFC